ncbi:MAG TPA: sulfatase [Cyclobacteriaceae bacterium]|nr:sulfatase [Cyclobacteriaceae bacterium]
MRLSILFLLVSMIGYAQPKSSSGTSGGRPNILYIMSDDHDADAISAYSKKFIQTPNIDRLAKEGIKFNKAFVGNSICSPARATLLTGQHSHKNGIVDNQVRFDSTKVTLPKLMQAAGYQTALIGKWHLHSQPSGFDFWKIVPGQGLYMNPRFIEMSGKTVTLQGYATDVITNEAIQWLENRDQSKPFLLLLHHKAPHRNFVPKLSYLEIYHSKTFPEPETLNNDTTNRGSAWRTQTMSILKDMHLCADLKVDPVYLNDIPEYKPDSAQAAYYHSIMNRIPEPERSRFKEIYAERGKLLQQLKPQGKELLKYKYQWYMQDYLACVASIDENVGRILNYLDQKKLTNNTAVMYTSDQGFYLGENGWFDKRFAYDVSMQTPLLMRWPGQIKAGSVNNTLAQNIDYAPTILDIAGLPVPTWMDGLSLKSLVTGKQKQLSRQYLYYHYYEFGRDHTVIPHVAVRGYDYKLIYFYTVNEWELYDLKADPNEQKNLIQSPKHQKIVEQLKNELNKLRDHYNDHEAAGELK